MEAFVTEQEVAWLERRVGRLHARQRLGIEHYREKRIFGQGLNFFHLENWYSIHSLIRNSLRLAGLHGRGRRNARQIQVRHNRVAIPRLPASFDGFTILHLSDLHLDMSDDLPRVLAERVVDLEYDLCLITGDFRARTFGPWQPAVEGVRLLRRALSGRVLAVLGNHDTLRMTRPLEELGIGLLFNEWHAEERGEERIHVVGVDDPHFYRAHNLEKAFAGVPADGVAILLAHSPEIYRHAAYAGADLMLAGHTHGGQICLPGGIPLLCNARTPRALCAGAWRFETMQGYTSSGSGVCIVDVRLNCPPEVTLHTLHCAPPP